MHQFIHQTQINACCLTFLLLSRKGGVHVLDTRVQFATNKREDLYYLGVLRIGIAIKEAVEPIL